MSTASTLILDEQERDRRWRKVREEMEKRRLDCLIVFGTSGHRMQLAGNMRYLCNTNSTLEGYLVFPLQGEPTVVTFTEKNRVMWVKDFRGGHPTYSRGVCDRLRELRLDNARIGIVGLSGYYGELGFPHTAYAALIDNFPGASFEDATDLVENVRKIKTEAEIKCFEIGCKVGEKVMQAVIDTAKVGVTDNEIKAKMWDTLLLNGCDPGSMILFSRGKECNSCGLCYRGVTKAGGAR